MRIRIVIILIRILLMSNTMTLFGCGWKTMNELEPQKAEYTRKKIDYESAQNNFHSVKTRSEAIQNNAALSNWIIYSNLKYNFMLRYPPFFGFNENEISDREIVENIKKYKGAYSPNVFSLVIARNIKGLSIESGIQLEIQKPELSKKAGYKPCDLFLGRDPLDIISRRETIIGNQKGFRYEIKEKYQKTSTAPIVRWPSVTYVFQTDEYIYKIGTFGIAPNEDNIYYLETIVTTLIIGNIQ